MAGDIEMSDLGDQLYLPRKPRKCPSCGAKPIATILYGLPIYSDELEARLQAGKIEQGGRSRGIGAPEWVCTHCGQKFSKL
jgi:hypothetical protein